MKQTLSILTAVFAVLAFLVSCGGSEGSDNGGSGSNDSGETGSIYGIVTDKATGEPIINAGVELQPVGLKTVTGSDGQFEFNEVAAGEYTLYVTKTGYVDQSSSIVVESGKQSKGDVQLEKAPAALRIVDDNGKDISELDFGEKLADVSRQFNIFNDGYEKLEWELSFSADWIKSVSKEGGELKAGGTQGVIVNIDRSLLESGENVTTIHVTSNDGNKQLTVKATNATVLPTLNTLETTNITSSTAVLNAEILTKGVPSYSERGFVYALESNPTLENTIAQLTAKVSEENLYSATVTGLELGEEYYVRGYAINEAGIAYSTNEVKFSPEMDLPNVTTEEATNINLDSESATFNGTIVDEGDPAYTERGFVYGLTHNPSVENTKIEVMGSGKGKFSANVTEFEVGKVYYIRAYAINDKGVAYGQDVMLDLNGTIPQVKTEPVTDVNVGAGTAVFNGEIESLGDPAYTERGFVYGLTHNPTIDDTKKVVSGSGTGAFSANISELVMNDIYYIRAYATNVVGTFYGDEIVLDFSAKMPVVNTNAVTAKNIGAGSATFNGSITSVGDPEYTERGFVYGLTHNPTIDDTKKVVSGTGIGVFSANVTGLAMNKIYYIRAYATNIQGTVYGSEVSADFSAIMPVLTTNAVTVINIGGGSATFNGSITSLGDPAYTERGFVYGLTHSPTIDDTKKVVSGSGTGAFSANVTGLAMNKIYYIRAYATNDAGTVYGTEVSADFSAIMPVVTTSAVTVINLTAGTATLNGKIDSVGDPAYTERGFVYGTVHNPTIEDNTKKIASGTGTGDFSANVGGLVLNTTYYIRAYAKNVQGVSYGSEVSLTFKGTVPTVKTSAATNVSIGSKTATFNGSVENVGNPAYTERGFVYATVHNPTIEDNTKKIASGSGTGAFYVNVTNLTMNQIYYIRAYATNLQGTAYGSEVTLNFNAIKPTVTTSAVTSINIGAGSATFNGKITSTGDPSYTERGFVYSLAQNPTINDTKKVVSGSGTGAFSVNVTGLVMNKIYYIRAYAKNDGGTAYGDEVSVGWHECGTANITPCIDSTTNLIWSAKSDSRVKYWLNNSYCNDLDEGGYNDWRYPNIDELRSLSNCANTGLGGSCKVSANTGCLSGNNCWSSDTCGECGAGIISKFGDSEWIQSISPRTEGNYWLFDFSTGKIDWYRSKYYYDGAWRYNTDAYVRCVR